MYRICLSLICLWVTSTASAQNQKVYDLVQFKNPLEQAYFDNLFEGDTNYIALLLVAGETADSADLMAGFDRLEELYLELDSAKLVRKRPKKLISTVFKTVHDRLLRQYSYENQFSEVFTTGKYNCVSATALYSYMLGRLGIPHAIMETPNHVYVLVNYREQLWVMESTDPEQGYYRITDKTHKKGLDDLVAQKIITPEQRNSPDLDSILGELFPEQPITASRLVSIQYYNQMAYDVDKHRWMEAFQEAAKAYLIHSDTANLNALTMSVFSWIEQEDLEHPVFVPALEFALENAEFGTDDREALFSSFLHYGGLHHSATISDSLFDRIATAYRNGTVGDSLLHNKITAYYHCFKAQKLLLSRDVAPAFPYAKDALLRYPDVESMRIMVGTLSIMAIYNLMPLPAILDSIRMIDSLAPEIRTNELWLPIYMELLSAQAWHEVLNDNFSTAKLLLEEFESNARVEDMARMDRTNIEKVYGRVLMDYYKSDRTRAAKTLATGLEYLPDSEILLYYKKKLSL